MGGCLCAGLWGAGQLWLPTIITHSTAIRINPKNKEAAKKVPLAAWECRKWHKEQGTEPPAAALKYKKVDVRAPQPGPPLPPPASPAFCLPATSAELDLASDLRRSWQPVPSMPAASSIVLRCTAPLRLTLLPCCPARRRPRPRQRMKRRRPRPRPIDRR